MFEIVGKSRSPRGTFVKTSAAEKFAAWAPTGEVGERRASQIAAMINEGGPHRLSRDCLITEPVAAPARELIA